MSELLEKNSYCPSGLKKNLPFILLTVILFIAEARPLVMQGMFFDGTIYFSIARNMANHIGSTWLPQFYNTPFFEHPSFGLFLQSLLFRLLGSDSVYIDKLYSLMVALLNILAVVIIWRKTLPLAKACLFWIPILVWLLLFNNFINIQSGYLEPTLTVFTSFASLLILQGAFTNNARWFFAAGLLITIAFFVNGLEAFFPIAIPGIYWLVFRTHSFLTACKQTILIIIITSALVSMVLLYPPAYQNMHKYFQQQLWPSLIGSRMGKFVGWKHLYGFWSLVHEVIYILGITLILLLIQAKKNRQLLLKSVTNAFKNKWVIFFFLIALCGSLPVILSSRQSDHYYYQAYPFLVLMFAHILTPLFAAWIPHINIKRLDYRLSIIILGGVLITTLSIVAGSIGDVGRDKSLLTDVISIKKIVPKGAKISLAGGLQHSWALKAYLYRYNQIFSPDELNEDYYLQPRELVNQPSGYHLMNIQLREFNLFKKQ